VALLIVAAYVGLIIWLMADLHSVQRRYGYNRVGPGWVNWLMIWVLLLVVGVPLYLWYRHEQKQWPMWPPPIPGREGHFRDATGVWFTRTMDGRWVRWDGANWVEVHKIGDVPAGLTEV
jgi:hypothetical protein